MGFIARILISAIVGIAATMGAYNFLPLSFIEHFGPKVEPKLGATITTIAGTDTISSSRTTINNNFTNLNNGKIENSTTSVAAITTLSNLVSIGTITTGTWNGSTLGVAYGGTGSTTLASNHILLGNGTNAATSTNGFGTSGQFLQSQGANTPPIWATSAVDQAANYTWSGNHIWQAASSTFSNGVSIGFSTTTNATTTSLQIGGLASTSLLIANSFGVGVATTAASTTEIGGNLMVRGVCITGCGVKFEAEINRFTANTGADGATFYTHTGDTAVTQVFGSEFQYNPDNWLPGTTFRFEATGGTLDGTNTSTIGLATTTTYITGTSLTGFTSTVGRSFNTTSTFTTTVMPAATQTMFCAISNSTAAKTVQITGCRLVALIPR